MIRHGLVDWRNAFRLWRLWIALGDEDIRDRYRRTAIGALWIAASFAVFVAVKVAIFGRVMGNVTTDFGLFVTIGFGAWTFINAMVLDACTAYTASRHWILGVTLPYPVYILQVVYRNLKIFAWVLVVVLAAALVGGNASGLGLLAALAGLAIYPVTAMWLAVLLAPICARVQDVYHAIQTGMRLLFFITPILWMPSINATLGRIAEANPLTHFIRILREPLMHGTVPTESWAWVGAINIAGLVAAVVVYSRTRHKIVFWV